MVKANPKIIVILGQTASGKSDLAIKLAKKYDGEIISADSRQVYRGMDLGTGKLARDKKQDTRNKNLFISGGVKHYLIDISNPGTEYNVSNFKKDAEKIITDILQRGKLPIICGGIGFWISAIVDNKIFPEVKPNKKLRETLTKKSAEQLFLMLKKLDPERAKSIDQHNKVRLIRAIEICKELGKVPNSTSCSSPFKGEGLGGVNFLQIGIDVLKEKLHKNIKTRLEKRFKAGLIKEVENLHKKYATQGESWIPFNPVQRSFFC